MYDVEGQRKEGHSYREIAFYLAGFTGFKVEEAHKEGYSYAEIANYQTAKATKALPMLKREHGMPRTVGFIDTNLGIDHALALMKEFEVYYFIAGAAAYPSIENKISGDGFKGLHKVDSMMEAASKDFVVITDCCFGKDADIWRGEGKDVYGPSAWWAENENNRVKGWQRLQEMGVGVPDGVVVHGLDECLDYIEKNEDGKTLFFPKVGEYRGNKETGKGVKTRTQALVALTQAGFGPYLTTMEILIQRACPGLELGVDVGFNGRDYIRPFLYTIEVKGEGTIGVWVEENGIDEHILNKVKPSLIKSGYHGNISFEFFWDGRKVRVHDPTSRDAWPCGAIQSRFIKNYPEYTYKIAAGQDVRAEVDPGYVTQVGVYTDDIKSWEVIHFPQEIRKDMGFRRIVRKAGDYWFVPGDQVVATAMGHGKTPKAAVDAAGKIASQIEMSNSSFPAKFETDVLQIIKEVNAMKGDDFHF
jgi:hypothetical protein